LVRRRRLNIDDWWGRERFVVSFHYPPPLRGDGEQVGFGLADGPS
jgi:hypothetical protein